MPFRIKTTLIFFSSLMIFSSFQDESRQELPFRMLSQSIVKSLILKLDITVVKNWLKRRHAPIHLQLATFLALNYLGDGIQNYGRHLSVKKIIN